MTSGTGFVCRLIGRPSLPTLSKRRAEGPRRRRRSLWRGLVPVAACLAFAAIGFFGVIWLMTPRWSVEEVRLQLARIDFDSLEALRNFNGEPAASHLPARSGLAEVGVALRTVRKGSAGPLRKASIRGLWLCDPESAAPSDPRVVGGRSPAPDCAPPVDQSLSAAPSSGYLPALIGETVSVAWTDGDVVYVCLVEGGEDSLATLRQILGASAA